MIIYIVIGVIVLIILWFLMTYNTLVTLRNRVREAWSEIDVQLKRRSSLIPNLVETVKGYAKHEKEVFENVTKARSAMMEASSLSDKAKADNMLTGALKSLFAVAEAYPDLKASQNFSQLQSELTDTENKIEDSRRFYNANVRDLNTKIQMFPYNILAGMFHFQAQEFFQATNEEKQDVKVSMS